MLKIEEISRFDTVVFYTRCHICNSEIMYFSDASQPVCYECCSLLPEYCKSSDKEWRIDFYNNGMDSI